jgi:cell division protein ZapA
VKNSGIKVKIFNTEYNLQGENHAEVEKIANYVDTLMQRINFESPNQSGETIAVVTALNVAENIFKAKKAAVDFENECTNFLSECVKKLDDLNGIIDTAL